MKVLVVGCHFDDAEIGIGGTLIRHIETSDDLLVTIVNAEENRSGSPDDRLIEQRMAAWAKYSYTPFYGKDIAEMVQICDAYKPDILYIPWDNDTHQDHVRASIIGKAVSRKKHINTFFYDSGSALNFIPNVFVEIDWEKKLKLLKCFESQNLPYEKIQKHDAYMATLIGSCGYAEGLVAQRYIFEPGLKKR